MLSRWGKAEHAELTERQLTHHTHLHFFGLWKAARVQISVELESKPDFTHKSTKCQPTIRLVHLLGTINKYIWNLQFIIFIFLQLIKKKNFKQEQKVELSIRKYHRKGSNKSNHLKDRSAACF